MSVFMLEIEAGFGKRSCREAYSDRNGGFNQSILLLLCEIWTASTNTFFI